MRYLASIEINDVLLEAGAKLNGAFLAAGLIDELVLYQSPKEFGDDGLPMFEANGEQLLSVPPVLHLIDSCQLGGDTRTIYRSN